MINRGPSIPLNGRFPKEAWIGKEVSLLHLRVFGCIFYVHVDDELRNKLLRNKLDVKSKKCIFIGYDFDEFRYQFWDDKNQKVIRSRGTVFNERVTYKDKTKEHQGKKDFVE